MAFEHDYHEVVNMLDGALLAIFRGLQQHYRREIDVIKSHFPSDDLVFPDKTVRIVFRDGVKMLNDAGWTDNGKPIPEDEDFSTPTERKLGELVKQQFGTD
jgi:aspartyl-tRNA synthetase